MARKFKPTKREVLPDPVYNSKLITRAINAMMVEGKRGLSQKIMYGALEKAAAKTGKEPLQVFKDALDNIMPTIELKVRRVGGANYQVPVEVKADRRTTLGLRWLIKYSRLRNEKTMLERLAGELADASNGVGASVKKKDDTHKMAEANKAFAHFRW